MKFFKPEDFDSYHSYPAQMNATAVMANIANGKLEREGKIVYSNEAGFTWRPSDESRDKQAILINIQQLEKCEHKWNDIWALEKNIAGKFTGVMNCRCGIKVQSKGFEEVE